MTAKKTRSPRPLSVSWVQENRFPIYRTNMIPDLRRKYHVGQRITVTSKSIDLYGRTLKLQKSCTVFGVYPNIVAVVDRNGIVECFRYVELEMMQER